MVLTMVGSPGASVVVATAAEYRAKLAGAGLEFRAGRPSVGDIVATTGLAFGARLAAERTSTPWIGVVLPPGLEEFLEAGHYRAAAGARELARVLSHGAHATRPGRIAAHLILDRLESPLTRHGELQ